MLFIALCIRVERGELSWFPLDGCAWDLNFEEFLSIMEYVFCSIEVLQNARVSIILGRSHTETQIEFFPS